MAASADLGAAPPPPAAVSTARADANLLGLLGLELLLLVFFIMLGSAAKPDAERAAPVIQSLRESFRYAIAPDGDPAFLGGDSLGEPRLLLDRAARKLQSALPLGAASAWSDGQRMFVDLPVGGFFPSAGSRLSALARERLQHIGGLIRDATEGRRFALSLALTPEMPDAAMRLASAAATLGAVPWSGTLAAHFDRTAPADRIRFQMELDGSAEGAR